MRKIVWALIVAAAYWLHGYFIFSPQSMGRFVAEQARLASSSSEKACEAYADDVEIDIIAESPQGRWEVEGDKSQICAYLKQASASFIVLQASLQMGFEDLTVQRSGFPWLKATVKYTQTSTVSARGMPTMYGHADDTVVVRRGLTGLKIVKYQSRGKPGFK